MVRLAVANHRQLVLWIDEARAAEGSAVFPNRHVRSPVQF